MEMRDKAQIQVSLKRPLQEFGIEVNKPSGICTRALRLSKSKEIVKRVCSSFAVLMV